MKLRKFFAGILMLGTTLGAYADANVAIRTDFPGGNALVKSVNDDVASIAPDLRGGRDWFYWCVEAQVKRPGTVTFSLPDAKIGNQGPAISLDQGNTWEYMGNATVKGNTFTYHFTDSNRPVRFAVTIPYLQKDLDAFLKRNASNPHLVRTTLTKSKAGRDVELLQIGKPGPGIEAVCFTCRHHACETMASYLLEGFIQAAINETPEGDAFRSKYVLYVIPFVDKDGVEEGDQGKGRAPHDHNRDYGADSIFPEIDAIEKLAVDKNIRYLVDWHCPTLLMDSHQIFYFCGPKLIPPANFENVTKFSDAITKAMPKSAPSGPAVWLKPVKYQDKGDLCTGFFAYLPGIVMATALEVPFAPPGKAMDPASVRTYGEGFLKAWTETEFTDPPQYDFTLNGGTLTPVGAQISRDGRYAKDTVFEIAADTPPAGKVFDRWTGDVQGIENVYDPTITLKTPEKDAVITATYREPGTCYPLTVNNGAGTGSYSRNTVVDIEAAEAPFGQAFYAWRGDVDNVVDVTERATSLTMAGSAATLTAEFRPIDQELLGWWKFEDVDGTVIRDSSANGNDLSVVGFDLSEKTCAGKLGRAIRFEGSATRAIHPTLLSKMPKALTIACWIKAEATQSKNDQLFLEKTNKNVRDQFFCRLAMKAPGTPDGVNFVYRIGGPGMTILRSKDTWQDGVWFHYALTWDADGVKEYFNGKLTASRNDAGPIGDGNDQPLTIGGGFTGAMDDLQIYSVALREAEIKALMSAVK